MFRPNWNINRRRDVKYYKKWGNTEKVNWHGKYFRLTIDCYRLSFEKIRIGWNFEVKENF